jgi:hypothetical protein
MVVPWGVIFALAVVVLGRLLCLHEYLRPDEAGYLVVGGQWHAGGSSLYGNYWVDRPPLLVTIFGLAARLGGALPLRLIGMAAAAAAVIAVAWAAHRLSGRRAATAGAIVAATLLVSPLSGAPEVDGELLAAPFVAFGFVAVVHALLYRSARSTMLASAAAGACAVAAVLVKQNMVDVAIFAAAMAVLAGRTVGVGRIARLICGFVAGASAMAGAVAAWTTAQGTSLHGVWFAMYPFRLDVSQLQLAGGLHPRDVAREHVMGGMLLLNGMAFIAALIILTVIRRQRDGSSATVADRIRRRVPVALVAVMMYDSWSILVGRDFWPHYLIELVVPLSVGAGLVVARWFPRLGQVAVAVTVLSALAATIAWPKAPTTATIRAGQAIARASRPGDSIVTMNGQPEFTYATKLPDPYPYLWKTPETVLDPHARLLAATLDGPHSPTWFAADATSLRHAPPPLRSTLTTDYHHVATFGHKLIYLRNGANRITPTLRRTIHHETF